MSLTCDECFAILEYLALEALDGAEEEKLEAALRRHLEMCPDCREHHLKRLQKLEERLGSSRGGV